MVNVILIKDESLQSMTNRGGIKVEDYQSESTIFVQEITK